MKDAPLPLHGHRMFFDVIGPSAAVLTQRHANHREFSVFILIQMIRNYFTTDVQTFTYTQLSEPNRCVSCFQMPDRSALRRGRHVTVTLTDVEASSRSAKYYNRGRNTGSEAGFTEDSGESKTAGLVGTKHTRTAADQVH